MFAAGNYAEAELNYKKAIQQNPNYGEAHYGLALTELQLLKTPQAYASMTRAADLLPNRQDVKIRLGDFALALYLSDPKHPHNLYNQLTKLSDGLLAKDPNSFDGLRLKGHLAAAENNTAEAADFFRQANRVKPNQPEIGLSLAQALITLKLDAEAESVAWDLINSNPTFSQIYDLIYKHYLFTGRLADAEKVMRTKVANNPKMALYVTQLAGHYYAFGKKADMESALRILKDHSQEFPEAHLLMGDFYNGIEELDEARRQFEQGAQSDPKQAALYQKRIENLLVAHGNKDLRPLEALVHALMMSGESDQAIHILTEELKKAPDSVALRTSLAATAAKAEKLDLAIDQYQQLASSNPKVADFPFYLGELYDKKGDQNRALTSFQKARQLAPRNVTFAIRLASELNQAGREDQAMAVYPQVLDFQPDNPVVLNNLAFLIADSGKNLDEAFKLAEKAKQKMPNQAVVDDTIGWIYLKRGMPKSAMQVFDTLTRQQPANPTYHYHYGLSLLKNGDKQKAGLELRSALAHHPSKGEELQIRQLIASAQ